MYVRQIIKWSGGLLVLILFMWFGSCQSTHKDWNEEIEVIEQFSVLQARLDADTNKLWVVNFWATTCPPCIKEMPHFRKLQEEFDSESLKILLVSLDRASDLDKRVYPFVKKHQIIPEVSLLEDQNYSAWTDKIDSSWYGALPATLIFKGNVRKFKFGMYESFEALLSDVKNIQK
jgi:thiol-disulfide isomerase/thioredoxin